MGWHPLLPPAVCTPMDILKKRITEALVEEVADNCRRLPSEEFFYRTTSLLSLLGSGTTDFSTLNWSPSTNGVYAFDAEVSGLDEMYTNFLRGVSALNEE